jgi:chemotaxis protein methyltransferase CheR
MSMTMPASVPVLPTLPPQIKMTDEEFRQLRAYIYELTGIYFQDSKKYLLEGRLGKRLQILNMARFDEYLQFIRFGSRRSEEIKFFYDTITINETFFFRNEPQFDAFLNTIVPEVVKTRGSRKIRVWSAASSSGEEAHTLAMIYLEKIKPKYPGVEIEIVGTDINSSVLATAKSGIYREYSIRNMPKLYLDKYFTASDGRYQLRDEVRRLARFDLMNLYDRTRMRQMGSFDVIFCCNVLIYFDTKSKIQVVGDLYNSLNTGGHLFIGYAESLHGISTAFKLISFPKTVAYKKE